ncbi:uncharacterized protein GIQ15_02539 [Arthroderma uncinatum]|uniref:uncharacterized protein n=1 Tax=Arthroderma uncinatum TaxID=74035 RepID=UPI00144AA881|nr:uncharacterized protein GIQ15_02539 [Arthroderma uncinatum]KAF3483215.1 hypothetical protein GIQ15_02539 [Arthroderma uncinatum]
MPPPAQDAVQQNSDAVKEKRKPVRRDPEKRRQQNVRAQRRYREKLRERLGYLEALEASTLQSSAIETPPAVGQSEVITTTAATQIISNTFPAYDASAISTSISSTWTLGECQPHIPQPDGTLTLNTWDSATHTPQLDDTTLIPGVWDSTACIPQSDDTSLALSLWDFTTPVPHMNDSPSMLNIWNPPTRFDDSAVIQDNSFHPDWIATIDCGCSIPHLQIETQGIDPSRAGKIKIFRFRQDVADPYANNLRIEQVCTISAVHTLATHVGITEAVICSDEPLSPFFRPIAETADNTTKENTVNAVQRIFKRLKPDLRPSSEQITIKHHPYIDILPFPTLRKNLILGQGEVDEDEFFHDILAGLACWGSAGIGKRDRQVSTGYASTGTPWDVRSWEATPSFLNKYWILLGGEEGELVRQSEWWRGIRGE